MKKRKKHRHRYRVIKDAKYPWLYTEKCKCGKARP